MHVLLGADDDAGQLRAEVLHTFPGARLEDLGDGLVALEGAPSVPINLETAIDLTTEAPRHRDRRASAESLPHSAGEGRKPAESPDPLQTPRLCGSAAKSNAVARINPLPEVPTPFPPIAFARQVLPAATLAVHDSIRGWAGSLFSTLVSAFPDDAPWRLHIAPRYGHGTAGSHRCELIRAQIRELLRQRRRQLLRNLEVSTTPFAPNTSLAQVYLTAPDHGLVSFARAPLPFVLRHLISAFPAGEIPWATDKAAPSRAFAKLVEAEQRLGLGIRAGETCIDLGASPGSWTYVALARGARVLAVDRSPLRDDLMRNPHLDFRTGDAFAFEPPAPVDWLLCDVIAAPERTVDLLLEWLRRRWCRRFVVTVKFKGDADFVRLGILKEALPRSCSEFLLTRLCANRNEVCAAGVVGGDAGR